MKFDMSYCHNIQNRDERYLFSPMLFEAVRTIFLFIACRLIQRIEE